MSIDFLNDFAQNIADKLPPGLHTWRQDVRKLVTTLLAEHLENHQLVSREVFDIQAKILTRTRKKLDAMEKELESLKSSRIKESA
jgi:BMFP domain-containing protein YqiC